MIRNTMKMGILLVSLFLNFTAYADDILPKGAVIRDASALSDPKVQDLALEEIYNENKNFGVRPRKTGESAKSYATYLYNLYKFIAVDLAIFIPHNLNAGVGVRSNDGRLEVEVFTGLEIVSILAQNRPTVGTLGARARLYFKPMPETTADGQVWFFEFQYVDYYGNQNSSGAFKDSFGVAFGYATTNKDGSITRLSFGIERIRQNPSLNYQESYLTVPTIRVVFLWK